MARKIAHIGEKFTLVFAREKSGAYPGAEFFDALEKSDHARLTALFYLIGDLGSTFNNQKFGDLGGGLYEFAQGGS